MGALLRTKSCGRLRDTECIVPRVLAPRSPSASASLWRADEANLAWALAEAAKPHLCGGERNAVYVAIGTGERFAAIRQLIRTIAVKQIPLRADLVQRCLTWLHAYAGHEDEADLRHHIEGGLIPCAVRVPRSAQ